MDKERFGKFIAITRRDLGMTQQALADQLHVTDKAVSKWERGLCYPDLTMLESLAAALGLTVGDLIACEKHREDTPPAGHNETDMHSLLEIANESQKRQKKKIWLIACLLALGAILLAGIIFLLVSANANSLGYAVFTGKKTNADGYFVYVEKGDRLLCLRCPDQQLYDTIEITKEQVYSIKYRWNRFTYRGTLYRCKAEDLNILGTPMDVQGSAIGIGSLLGIDCAIKKVKDVYPDPNHAGAYLYTFYFYYNGDGSDYFMGKHMPQTPVLTVEDCRSAVPADYDGDGITELFVLTKYDEEPYMLCELEGDTIVSCFVDEVPADVLEQLEIENATLKLR